MRGKNLFRFFLFVAIVHMAIKPFDALAQKAYSISSKESEVSFLAVGKPGFLKINGKGGLLTCQGQETSSEVSGECEVVLTTFDTGIELRDKHMKETYLEVQKFPKAQLKWNIKPVPSVKDGEEIAFSGQLKLHGVEKPVTGVVLLKKPTASGLIDGEASFEIKLSDFDVKIPKYLGVTVADTVDIKAKFKARAKG